MATVSIYELTRLAALALQRAGAAVSSAQATAAALVSADMQGLTSNGVSRIPQYVAFLSNNWNSRCASPRVVRSKGGSCLIDAQSGMAYEACALAVRTAIGRAREYGVGCTGVTNSKHFGAASVHLDLVGRAGLIGLAFSKPRMTMLGWNGRTLLFGTNPVSAIFPRQSAEPLVFDLTLSDATRGRVMQAAKERWSVANGAPVNRVFEATSSVEAALAGGMLPAPAMDEAVLSLIVELLAGAHAGAVFASEAESVFTDVGNQANLGQLFVTIDPTMLPGASLFFLRNELLFDMKLQAPASHIPSSRRQSLSRTAEKCGVLVPDTLYQHLCTLAGESCD